MSFLCSKMREVVGSLVWTLAINHRQGCQYARKQTFERGACILHAARSKDTSMGLELIPMLPMVRRRSVDYQSGLV